VESNLHVGRSLRPTEQEVQRLILVSLEKLLVDWISVL
jgi:hypothetical protein